MARTVGGVQIEIRGDDAHFERTMRDVRAEAGRTGQTMTREFRGAGNEAGKLKSQIMGTTSAFVGLAAVVTSTVLAGAITRAADEFAQMRSKINLSISAADDLLAVEKQLYQQAVANRAALEPTVALYQRLRGARADLTNEQTLAITDRWSKTLVISGASAQGAAAATLQFSQAIAGGVLRAEEFNSIIENNIRFVKVLADSLGVSVGDIRNLVNEGAITTETIFKALLDNSGALEAEFTKIPLTVNSAMVNVANAFTSYIGQADQASGTSAALAGFINSVASDFKRLADIVIVAAATVGGAVAGLAAARVVGGLYALATASGTATGALVALRGALTLIAANPVTLVITALAGAFAYMAVTSSDAEGALARANVALENSRRILAETNTLVSGENNPFAQISTQAEGAAGQVAKLAGVLEELQQGLANLREEGQIATALKLGEAIAATDASIQELEQLRARAGGRAFNQANLGGQAGLQRNIDRELARFDDSEEGQALLRLRQERAGLQNRLRTAAQGLTAGDLINQFRNGSPDAPAATTSTGGGPVELTKTELNVNAGNKRGHILVV
jgi:tape measure domain-containing protein